MSAEEPGKSGPLSRRDFLNAAALAAVAGTVGCAGDVNEQQSPEKKAQEEAQSRKNQPIIKWTEAVAAVQAFTQEKLAEVPMQTITGVALLTWDHGPKEKFIEVRWREKEPAVPQHFEYHNPDEPDPSKMEKVRVRTRERDFVKAKSVRAGDSAQGAGVANNGTAGWTIRYNHENVCISAMHALCAQFNKTAIGTTVNLAGSPNARLHSFEPISWDPDVFNLWDIAMAEYNVASDIFSETMRPCGNQNAYPYPMNLSINPTASSSYRKVGAATPICQRGYLNGFGTSATQYSNGKIAYFNGQLLMTAMANEGDSGAALVRESDNTVAGILYSGDTQESVACPLFAAPLTYVGPFVLGSGQVIPAFTSPTPPPPRCWIG